MLLDPTRDESLDHKKVSNHMYRTLNYELDPVRSTKL